MHYSGGADHHEVSGERTKRQAFQTKFNRKIPDLTGINQGCRTTGYETRDREVCEEVVERVCVPTTGVKYRKEIYTRCDTRIRQDCNTTMREVPKEVCKERNTTECFPDFKVVEDTRYTDECENIVQHVCEEHYKVPVPKPIVFPVPIFPPTLPVYRNRRMDYKTNFSHQRKKRQLPFRDAALLLRQLKSALKVPPPPIITHKELPAPPGCRSLVTQKCHKIPEKFNRRVPEEVCKEVPGVECHLELEKVEEPKCYNVPVEECDDVLKEVPYLVEEEECENVPTIECTQIEEQVPIQVCTSIDINRDVLITNFKEPEDEGDDDEDDEDEEDTASKLTLNRNSELIDSLKSLLEPGDLELIRERVFGNRKVGLVLRNEKSLNSFEAQSEKKQELSEKPLMRKVVSRRELEKLKSKALKDSTKTILLPGQLDELKETGIWNLSRVKKSEGTDYSTSKRVKHLLRELIADKKG